MNDSSNDDENDEGFDEQSEPGSGLIIRSGSVRGKRNNVRHNVNQFMSIIKRANIEKADLVRDYEREEVNKCVVYVTSVGIVRKTFENCRKLKAILDQHFVDFDERDIFIDNNFKRELVDRLLRSGGVEGGAKGVLSGRLPVPVLFVHGKLVGGVDAVERLNECGHLTPLLSAFQTRTHAADVCRGCGGSRHVPCAQCNGSRKSHVLHFTSDWITLRCSHCSATGIQRCLLCSDL